MEGAKDTIEVETSLAQTRLKSIDRLQIPEAFNIFSYSLLESGSKNPHFEILCQNPNAMSDRIDREDVRVYKQREGFGCVVSYVMDYEKSDTTPLRDPSKRKVSTKSYVASFNPNGSIEFSVQNRIYYTGLDRYVVLGSETIHRIDNKDIIYPINGGRPDFINEAIKMLFPKTLDE